MGAIRVALSFVHASLWRAGGGAAACGEGGFGCKGLVLRWIGKFLGAVTGGGGRARSTKSRWRTQGVPGRRLSRYDRPVKLTYRDAMGLPPKFHDQSEIV